MAGGASRRGFTLVELMLTNFSTNIAISISSSLNLFHEESWL